MCIEERAKGALQDIVNRVQAEAAKVVYDSEMEATQSLTRLEQGVSEARARFDSQDALIATGLGELAQRLQVVDAWARAEPARVAALVQAAPAQQRWRRSPGGTTLQQAPLPPVPATPPAQTRGTPEWDAWQQQQQRPPIPDAWAAAAAAADASQTMPGATRHFNINTPGYTGGGGKGGAPYPREMRIDSRGCGSENKKLDITPGFDALQIWKDRATMFLSRERPDVRTPLA